MQMPQIQFDAYKTIVNQLPGIAKQLEIANKLKAWELKIAYREMTEPFNHAIEIDKILNGSN